MGEVYQISQMQGEVAPFAPGATDTAILIALRRGARELCSRSQIWRVDLPDIDLVASQASYTLPSYGAQIHRVLSVKLRSSGSASFDMTDPINPGSYIIKPGNTLLFSPSSSAPAWSLTAGMRVKAVLRPGYNDDEIPEWIVDRWGDAIAGYAKNFLASQPKKTYTDPAVAVQGKAEFNKGLTEAMRELSMDFKGETEGFSA